jgi:hypothetical protein
MSKIKNLSKIIGMVIKYLPVILVIGEALKMVQESINNLGKDDTKN